MGLAKGDSLFGPVIYDGEVPHGAAFVLPPHLT
jgi:hypothetical protein